MAIQRRFGLGHGDVFPAGAWLVGAVEEVPDFNLPALEGGGRPQQVDKETGLPVWSVPVLDGDEEAAKKSKTVTVKFLSRYKPVVPENTSGLPFVPVEFVGLTALPYVDDSGTRPRIAWSFRAEGMQAPGQVKAPAGDGKSSEKAAA